MTVFNAPFVIVRKFQQFDVRIVERGQQFAIRFEFKGENVIPGNLGPIENTHNRANHFLDVLHGHSLFSPTAPTAHVARRHGGG